MSRKAHFETFSSYIPLDLGRLDNFLLATGVIFLVVILRYFLAAGAFWFIFYRRNHCSQRLIYPSLLARSAQMEEIRWSLISAAVFGLAGALLGWLWQMGYTKIYLPFDEYGLAYLALSLVPLAVLHETYFYFTHRWMHHRKVFPYLHQVHHRSVTPSPWASFAFHPGEAIVQAAAIPLLVLVIPVHPTMLILYLTLMTISAVVNHLGFELLPRNSFGKFLGRHFVSALHHSGHHRRLRYNFSLYFPLWDRIFGTEDPAFSGNLEFFTKVQAPATDSAPLSPLLPDTLPQTTATRRSP